ncbi:MAG: sodium:proton antiporter [Burkholderiaceae bacterium]
MATVEETAVQRTRYGRGTAPASRILGGLAAVLPGLAQAAEINGAELGLAWAVPFAGILLCIALMPLLALQVWHHHYGKIVVAWALAAVLPMAVLYGTGAATAVVAHILLADYLPFIIFVGTLYVVAGGIHIRGNFIGTPAVNTGLLGLGAVLANVMGTTGASMLLIRPLIRANGHRRYQTHTFIFFIFIVANIAGSLTPLGDPPLFLGFLKGVDFFWTTRHMAAPMGVAVGILLALYFVIDLILHRREKRRGFLLDPRPATAARFGIEGGINFVLLALLIGAVLMSGLWRPGIEFTVFGVDFGLQNLSRDLAFLVIAALSLALTPAAARTGNQFSWGPIFEVAKLFFGIFVTMVPVLAMLKAGADGAFAPLVAWVTGADGGPNHAMYFWLTGALSSFLDNAPTYLAFFNLAGGDASVLMGAGSTTLMAISAGAVFMGANSYIGNAPNFMVVAIVQDRGLKMPSFFGYMAWSSAILIPLFVVITFIFFR